VRGIPHARSSGGAFGRGGPRVSATWGEGARTTPFAGLGRWGGKHGKPGPEGYKGVGRTGRAMGGRPGRLREGAKKKRGRQKGAEWREVERRR